MCYYDLVNILAEVIDMANNNNLGDEWKDTAYNLGGAFVDLGKALMHSVKTGVDIAYNYLNEADAKNSGANKASSKADEKEDE